MTTQHAKPGQLLCQFIRAIGNSQGDLMMAESYAAQKEWYQVATMCKALVSTINTGDLPAAMLPLGYEIAALLRPRTIVGRMVGLRRAPLMTRVLRQTVGTSGKWTAEGKPIPASALSLSQGAILQPLKVGAIRVLTDEVLKTAIAGSDEFLTEEAISSLVEALDAAFIDPANNGVANELPASITSGATEINSSGSTIAQIDADLEAMVDTLISFEMPLAAAAWVMSPITATHMAFLRGSGGAPAYPEITATGGTLAGLPVLTSTAVTASGSPGERFITLVEASEIIVADEDQASVEISRHAAVQLNDAPIAGAAQLTSLWQNNLAGLKSSRYVNWQRRRDGAAVVLRNVTY